jgi:putative FmdB family regulatory protein
MPTYHYECSNPDCPTGGQFTLHQSMKDDALTKCPECGSPVERIIGPAYVSSPKSDSDLRDKGFAKLVRRDKGVYENVTALDHESRYWDANKPGTMPDLSKRISD